MTDEQKKWLDHAADRLERSTDGYDRVVARHLRAIETSPSASIADTAGAEPVAWRHSLTHCLYETEEEVPLADGDEWAVPLYLSAPPAPSSDTAGAGEHVAWQWRNKAFGTWHFANDIHHAEFMRQNGHETRALAVAAPPAPSVADAQQRADWIDQNVSGNSVLIQAMKNMAVAAPSVADAAGASDDKALLDYLDNEENPVDTIYFDDGKIIDLAGRRTVREAIRAAIAKESGND